ncbi:MAG: class I SAM-dependent methyltransferase [Parerythrobacter sp.]
MSQREIYYDSPTGRLVFTDHAPDSSYWDNRWHSQLEDAAKAPVPSGGSFITNTTARHLPKGSKVLEGGCGNGMHSRHLHEAGYDVTSVDWAPTTIEWLKANIPQIKPVEADLRALPFKTASFDGFWSLGVIEHFYDGYEPLVMEMSRVIRPGGMLFLTFPYMSPLRTVAGRTGRFASWEEQGKRHEFHQFALRHRVVIDDLANDFEVVSKTPMLGLSGMEGMFDGFVDSLSQRAERKPAWGKIRAAVDRAARPFASHMILVVLRRR